MSAPMNFRTAFNGFNREDVVHFIEYLNAKHTAEVNQLKSELETLRSTAQASGRNKELDEALEANEQLTRQLAELQQRCEALEAGNVPAVPCTSTELELEAYRRAERAEREAKERAQQVYNQVNGVLADAASQVDGTVSHLDSLAEQLSAQLSQLQKAVTDSRHALTDASATLYTIRPTGDNS